MLGARPVLCWCISGPKRGGVLALRTQHGQRGLRATAGRGRRVKGKVVLRAILLTDSPKPNARQSQRRAYIAWNPFSLAGRYLPRQALKKKWKMESVLSIIAGVVMFLAGVAARAWWESRKDLDELTKRREKRTTRNKIADYIFELEDLNWIYRTKIQNVLLLRKLEELGIAHILPQEDEEQG